MENETRLSDDLAQLQQGTLFLAPLYDLRVALAVEFRNRYGETFSDVDVCAARCMRVVG